ncbi:MAG: hypothetical protein SOV36_03150 [Anaerostipes faecalis]|nr:hypothetical protein [Anaerostipes faecalis]
MKKNDGIKEIIEKYEEMKMPRKQKLPRASNIITRKHYNTKKGFLKL